MIKVGNYNTLKVIKEVDFGMYLDGGTDEILLPNRYVPKGLKMHDDVTVFIYHDNEGRLIATTDKPVAVVGDIAMMEVNEITAHGAFLKWGIMKDVFIPISLQERKMHPGDKRLVQLFVDERTGRVTATEKIDKLLSNYQLTVKENDEVDITIFQQTDIGYKVIINNQHLGVLHYNEMFREVEIGDRMRGYIKKIREGNKIDVSPGVKGYAKVKNEEERIMDMLRNNNGYLPYNDKSDPEDIYTFFGISKKAFKITLGALYKKRLIEFTQTGVKLIEQ